MTDIDKFLTDAERGTRQAFDAMHGPGAWERMKRIQEAEDDEIRDLCERIGYGRVLHATADLWAAKDAIGAHTTGPAISLVVPCGCRGANCDWCCGSGRVTKRVRRAKAEAGE